MTWHAVHFQYCSKRCFGSLGIIKRKKALVTHRFGETWDESLLRRKVLQGEVLREGFVEIFAATTS